MENIVQIYSKPISEMIVRLESEPPIPFIWSGIKKGSFGFIYGPPKSGKTIICENLGLSLAAGISNFMDLPLLKEDNLPVVLFVSLEEYWQPRTERNHKQLSYLLEQQQLPDLSNYHVITESFPRFFSKAADWDSLETMITSVNANIVFIDSLTRLYIGDIEMSATSQQVTKKLRELSNKLGITLIVIHHTKKMSGRPLTLDSLAGSRVLAQEADFLIGINKGLSGDRYLKEVSFRYKSEDDENVTLFTIDDHLWARPTSKVSEVSLLSLGDGRRDNSIALEILDFIEETADPDTGEVTTEQIEDYFITVKDYGRATIFENLKRLLASGSIQRATRGKYKLKGE